MRAWASGGWSDQAASAAVAGSGVGGFNLTEASRLVRRERNGQVFLLCSADAGGQRGLTSPCFWLTFECGKRQEIGLSGSWGAFLGLPALATGGRRVSWGVAPVSWWSPLEGRLALPPRSRRPGVARG